nr:uncharacterized protein LOC107441369 isoform X1 [Parasteatoda tepidariorum]
MKSVLKKLWFCFFLLLFGFFTGCGMVCAEGICDTSHVEHCYDTLVHYEGLGFPLYGKDEEELNETCETMNDSFECLQAYSQHCNESEACDDEGCSQMLEDIETFSTNTGLRNVEKELCNPGATREAYLENYSCLASNVEHYAACHNDSQMSQDFMTTIKEPSQAIAARCCFFTWYHDCFTNITRDFCNDNATFVVSIILHNLLSHISEQVCGKSPDVCDRPPLPPTHKEEEEEIIPLDDGHKNITDVDNTLEEHHISDATFHVSSFSTLCITFMNIYLLMYII